MSGTSLGALPRLRGRKRSSPMASTASDPKKVLFYDTGHDLNDFQALEDRYEWLVNQIHLRREPIVQETK